MDFCIEFFNSAHGWMEPHNIIIAIFIYVTFISAQVTTCQVSTCQVTTCQVTTYQVTTCAIHRIPKNNPPSVSNSSMMQTIDGI